MGCINVTEGCLTAVMRNCKNMANLTLTGTSVSLLPAGLCNYRDVTASCLPLASPALEVYKVEKLNILKGKLMYFNTLPPATDSGRTARTPLYPPVQAVPPLLPPPFFFPVPDIGTSANNPSKFYTGTTTVCCNVFSHKTFLFFT